MAGGVDGRRRSSGQRVRRSVFDQPEDVAPARREIVAGKRMFGYECSSSVADIDANTEGNIAGAMQYDSSAE
jgi:hypothetical protein